MNALAQFGTAQALPSGITREDVDRMLQYAGKDLSESTRKSYNSQWRRFTAWCEERGAMALPAASETVAAYLADRAPERSRSWLIQASAAIRKAHRTAGADDPTNAEGVRRLVRGVKREHGTPSTPKAAARAVHIRRMVDAIDTSEPTSDAGPAARAAYLRALRDRALILFGYAAALRRSELAAMEVEHLAWNADGVELTIPPSKSDQEGTGQVVAVNHMQSPEYCPLTVLRAWMNAAGIESGPVFRPVQHNAQAKSKAISGRTVRDVVVRTAETAGLEADSFGGHSLRRGHITEGTLRGASLKRLQQHAPHADPRTTTGYIEAAKRMETNTSTLIGL